MNRRDFLISLAATPFFTSCKLDTKQFTGQLIGANSKAGHRLLNGSFPAFSQTKRTKIAIIGGGISGLSTGWMLQQNGITDYKIFELESQIGGNSRSGQNQVSAYPWGAHYLPIPNADAHLLKSFLSQCGAITANADSQKPTYNERYLCFAPQERLYINGLWQEGLVPNNGLTEFEKNEIVAFEREMQCFNQAIGKDGKPAFTIPLAASSSDPVFLQLDKISFSNYLHQQGWHTKPLHWYANYGCRDDYGVHYNNISAWAGIHYFAARRGQAQNAEDNQELTWPEGNAWLVNKLAQQSIPNIEMNAMVHSIEIERHQVSIDVLDLTRGQNTRWLADEVIYASPVHTLPYILRNKVGNLTEAAKAIQHAPWLVANITINSPEALQANVPLSWDNVIYNSNALGYVVANHQDVEKYHEKMVLTYYQSFGELNNDAARQMLYQKTWQFFADSILIDLQKAHPRILQQIETLDIWRWGHAMTYPHIGFLGDKKRLMLNHSHNKFHIAHTDAAGISIFEEAFEQGTRAAKFVINRYKI